MKKYIFVLLVSVCMMACGSDTKLFQQAKLATFRGDYAKALSLYSQLIKQNPQHAAALTNRGLLWERMPAKTEAEKAKNLQFAKQDYLRSLELNPNQPETYNNLGALAMQQGQNGVAESYFSEALARNPAYFRALVNRGVAYTKMGDIPHALRDFAAASQLRPNDSVLLYNRALAYLDAGKYEQADYDFSHAIAVQPNNALLYVGRARALAKMGYPADAYDDLTQAIALDPTNALAYYYLGDLVYRNGDSNLGLGALVKAKELAPTYAPTYDLMGDMLAMQEPVDATANYMTALKLDPAHAAKYKRKLEMMKTQEGRYYLTTSRFFPQGRVYTSQGERRPVSTPTIEESTTSAPRAGSR